MSCGSPGNCSAGGFYDVAGGGFEAFVVSEVRGRWRRAEEVPGSAALNKGSGARITSVSCGPAGFCGAGGSYTGAGGNPEAFVVSAVDGTWRRAEEVPGTAALSKGNGAQIFSVSCGSAGHCSAGGYYLLGILSTEAFVVGRE